MLGIFSACFQDAEPDASAEDGAGTPEDGGRVDAGLRDTGAAANGDELDANGEPGKSEAARDAARDATNGSRPADGAAGDAGDAATVRADGGAQDGGPRPDAAGADAGEAVSCAASERMPAARMLRGDLGAHDPVIIESEGVYHVFVTGRGIPTKRSTDLVNFQSGPSVFAQNPGWVAQRVPGATDLWAPDISQFNGLYHLYYSASTFGSNRSCIGHATRASLSRGSWQDRGPVICSNENGQRDDWNAIDPNVVVDEQGTPWLSFGSFWSGLKLIKLNAEGARADQTVLAIAGRNGGAIEAPFIIRRCGYYYLFVSFDTCCKGADSTYNIRVGRSRSVMGPYVDRAGMQLTRGGGTLILQGDARWKGPGHNAVLLTSREALNVYHAYAAGDGHSELRISELAWDAEGWPRSAGP